MIQTESSRRNINLDLNYVTIDDILKRAIALSRPGFIDNPREYREPELRKEYGSYVFGDKVVLVRTDLNSPIEQKEGQFYLKGKDRIKAAAPTIRELSDYGAKVVVITHQGTAGKADCISLEPHKNALEEVLSKEVIFKSAHWYGIVTQDIIKGMKRGEVFLLDNIRKLSDEVSDLRDPGRFAALPHSYMSTLGPLADFVVNDAFSASHRWHGSIIGFPHLLNLAGRLTQREIQENRKLISDIRNPYTLLLGGVKISGYLDFVEDLLEHDLVDNVLAAGALGILAIHGSRYDGKRRELGAKTYKFLAENELYHLKRKVANISKDERFVIPLDFKVKLGEEVRYMTPEEIHSNPNKDKIGIYGIGPQTLDLFLDRLKNSQTVYLKGSPTKDDEEEFLPESKRLIEEIVRLKQNGATTILSGGDTNNLISKFGFSAETDFTHFTLAGGAAAEYHAGNILPGVVMLNTSYNAFWGLDLSTGLPLGYPRNISEIAPRIPESLRPFKK
ncbi:phosphoglycerate kinase [Candidatus Woesearchaeota archaeon]|nr:phosphoglycerate kinase [Candidatus Woesearchaeota archaeon]